MPQVDTLIRTKLRQPFIRPALVPRPRLQARIAEGLHTPLTLIVAPAGFGKTTLVASCIAECGMPVAWLSLDKDDNQEGRFLGYVIAALQEVDPAIGREAAQLLAAAREIPPQAILTSLINDLVTAGRDFVQVVDDYQLIHSKAVHDQVMFLLDYCPKIFHLVIATRSDPPLPVSRLRARGQMVELRATDLRFTQLEASQFLSDVMGLHLDTGAVAALEERTEGWIAGLQMAALALQGALSERDRKDVSELIAGFSGTNRYILDYLLAEVLVSQSPEIEQFLLHTSILERLSVSLCDAVMGQQAARNSRAILEYLERANLFLVPLDDQRLWYRYHHLFADLLRAQLQRSLCAEDVAALHVRAADWHAEHGSILDAINHASAAADEERVERFIEQNYMEMVSRGEQIWMRFWKGKLSKELVHRRPWLCIYEAHSHAWFGELDEAERLLEAAEKHLKSRASTPDDRRMRGHWAYVKSRVTAMRGNIGRAIDLCLQARQVIPADNLSLQFNTRVTLGYEYFLAGDYERASQVLDEVIQMGIAEGAIIYTVAAACFLARLRTNQGSLHKAHDTYQMAAQLIPEERREHRDARSLIDVGLADVLYQWNDLDAAFVHLQRGLALLPLWGKADDIVLANITLAYIHLARGNLNDAREAVNQASRLVRTSGVFSEARCAVELAQVKLWLAEGDLLAADRWATLQEERSNTDEPYKFENELVHIAQARVMIAHHQLEKAIALLAQLEKGARSARRMGRVAETLVLQALALQQGGDSERALLALTDCLAFAAPEGYARILVDEGQPAKQLLALWLVRAGAGPMHDYAAKLLSQFNTQSDTEMAARTHVSSVGSLVEPLSEREQEVLHLVALGMTNKEIAGQLVVAPGTVKAHTSSIYRKLDVTNRTEAVARARDLGILH